MIGFANIARCGAYKKARDDGAYLFDEITHALDVRTTKTHSEQEPIRVDGQYSTTWLGEGPGVIIRTITGPLGTRVRRGWGHWSNRSAVVYTMPDQPMNLKYDPGLAEMHRLYAGVDTHDDDWEDAGTWKPLWIEALTGDAVVLLTGTTALPFTIETSADLETWTPVEVAVDGTPSWTIPQGTRLYFRSDDWGPSKGEEGSYQKTFTATGSTIAIGGDLASLSTPDKCTTYRRQYYRLFRDNTALVDASELRLPYAVGASGAADLLRGCPELVRIPAIYGKDTGRNGYSYFALSPKVESVPDIVIEDLPDYAYRGYISGTAIRRSPSLINVRNIGREALSYMVTRCPSLVKGSGFDVESIGGMGAAHIYESCENMRRVGDFECVTADLRGIRYICKKCSSLPELPRFYVDVLGNEGLAGACTECTSATRSRGLRVRRVLQSGLASSYSYCSNLLVPPEFEDMEYAEADAFFKMFWKNSKLTRTMLVMPDIEVNPAPFDESGYHHLCCYMFKDCRSLTQTFERLPTKTIYKEMYYSMFSGCAFKKAPIIEATEMHELGLRGMFANITELEEVTFTGMQSLPGAAFDYRTFAGSGGDNTVVKVPEGFEDTDNILPANWTIQYLPVGT